MTLLPTMSRPGCTVHVMCSVTLEVRAVADRGATESGSAEVLSSQRSCYSTECEETGHLLPTSGGGGWVGVTPGPSHWKSRSMWSCYSLSGLMYSTSVTVVILSLAKVHECMQKFIC